jgi:hypothetical protein
MTLIRPLYRKIKVAFENLSCVPKFYQNEVNLRISNCLVSKTVNLVPRT